jgi:signal transduction histidine kinase/response regulator of citrate/malate metabolism
MKNPKKAAYKILLFVVAFLVVLIGIIIYAQIYSQRNVKSLQKANENASATFEINNRLQELVYYTEAVDIALKESSKNKLVTPFSKNSFKDSLSVVEESIRFLKKQDQKNNTADYKNVINLIVRKHISINNIINANPAYDFAKIETLLPEAQNDSLYNVVNALQIKLENNLKATFEKTSSFSQSTLNSSKILAILFILALAILGTLIIKKLLDQITFISKLGKEKERADKSAMVKEQFLANMSHEIRTPINAVVGFTGLLQKTLLNADQKQFVDLIQHSGENLLAVVNDILDISKIEAGMMRITKQPFNLKEVCNVVRMMFEHKVANKKLSLKFEYDNNLPDTIIGDDERLSQILINLLNNAIKFTEKGNITLNVKLLQTKVNDIKVQFTVTDTGIGIAEDKLATIFERFEQAENDTARQFGGTGLGLSIVEKIVSLQNGTVKIESELNVGTTFIVTIDYLIATSADFENQTVLNFKEAKKEEVNFGNYQILVAEDNKINQTLIKYILNQWNVQFDIAENGNEVLSKMKDKVYDLILMDIQMPSMDGYQTSTIIRNELQFDIPIIAMTAHVMPTEKQKCINVGMNDYLSKPIDEKLLIEMLQKYLPIKDSSVLEEKPYEIEQPLKLEIIKNKYVDIKYLQDIFTGNEDFIQEILEQFKTQFPQEMEQLSEGVRLKDRDLIAKTTHHMKTTVTTLNPDTPIASLLLSIDNNTSAGQWFSVQQDFDKISGIETLLMSEINNALLTKSNNLN